MPKTTNVTVIVKSTSTDELIKLSRILYKLRWYTKNWEERFGSANKKNKKTWEAIADKWIDQHIKIEQ